MGKGIWVYFDDTDINNTQNTYGILGKAHVLSRSLESPVIAFGIGKFDENEISALYMHGADEVLLNDFHVNPSGEEYAWIVDQVVSQYNPDLVIFPSTEMGKEVSARLSITQKAGLTADCIDITRTQAGNNFIYSRAAINSSVIAQIECVNSDTELCTVKENIFNSLIALYKSKSEVKYYEHPTAPHPIHKGKVELISQRATEGIETIDFTSSRVILGAGRGLQNPEEFNLFTEVARKSNCEYGGTRALVESGIIKKNRQIGQSGISICPDVYVAFGISGATQHIAGIKESKIVVAVNIQPDAPIFKYANYAIVSDAVSILNQMACNY
ncbi:MAG: electron transfer flavoprotein subunit alpha/FixB family protein [Anaerocolumna sp.]